MCLFFETFKRCIKKNHEYISRVYADDGAPESVRGGEGWARGAEPRGDGEGSRRTLLSEREGGEGAENAEMRGESAG